MTERTHVLFIRELKWLKEKRSGYKTNMFIRGGNVKVVSQKEHGKLGHTFEYAFIGELNNKLTAIHRVQIHTIVEEWGAWFAKHQWHKEPN